MNYSKQLLLYNNQKQTAISVNVNPCNSLNCFFFLFVCFFMFNVPILTLTKNYLHQTAFFENIFDNASAESPPKAV